MASKHEYADKGSIRIIMVVVMKRNSKGAVLVDLRVANLYQGMVHLPLLVCVSKLSLVLALHLSICGM